MKKEELLGMEVYYEDNPQPKPPVSSDVWAFGDSDEEDDFDERCEDFDMDFEEDFAVVPVKGRIYKVRGLNIVARLKEIRPLTPTAGILEMEQHGNRFYINPSDLRKATREEAESYLED